MGFRGGDALHREMREKFKNHIMKQDKDKISSGQLHIHPKECKAYSYKMLIAVWEPKFGTAKVNIRSVSQTTTMHQGAIKQLLREMNFEVENTTEDLK